MTDYSLAFAPLVPWAWFAVLAALAVLALGYAFLVRARGAAWRAAAAAGLLLAIANPLAVVEERKPLTDIGLLVVDESDSMKIGERAARVDRAATAIRERLAREKDFELRIVRAGSGGQDGTKLFEALERALADVPRNRIAGVALLTDGQVHDAPKGERDEIQRLNLPGPVHGVIAGARGEVDRRLVLEQAPGFAIVAKPQTMTIRIDEGTGPRGAAAGARAEARVDIKRDGQPFRSVRVPVGTSVPLEFQLDKAGQTIFEIEVEAGPRELTLENNRQVVVVNGVRDRLRVLLVTGEPHPGERTWRNLLKSDPSVDLVHFTILRPPEAQDFTPVNELSLIAFPIRELFEVKLNEFDLVVFDRYRRRDVLAPVYLDNIVRYVRRGGALLISVGPNFSAPNSLFNSPVGQIMPGVPTGQSFEEGFVPTLSAVGRRHPVTADLPGAEGSTPEWGRWFRHIDTEPRRGQSLMNGAGERPLLLLDRVGEGRVAQLMSDQIWLWARGFDGGGPHAELLRRIAHWLMKEPELEENDLKARVAAGRVEVERRALDPVTTPVTVTEPDGSTRELRLVETRGGRQISSFAPTRPGLYRFTDGERQTLAAVGAVNPAESADVRASETLLKPAADATGGAVVWLADGIPDVRRVRPGREMGGSAPGGRGWIGFKANGDYVVTGVAQTPLMPGLLTFLLCLGLLYAAWRQEGR
ncbi:MAG: hypothetical protein JNN22_16290, partial [Rhodospirillales bacterium]|nr:hypothetical protein [Rhodospirillales bacterium]